MTEVILSSIKFVEKRLSSSPITNDKHSSGEESYSSLFGALAGSTVFGALHIVAWNFVFPTHIEQVIWWSAYI